MLANPTVVARGDPTQTQTAAPQGPQHSNTSFFTFLIALLILVFASAALILRTVLLRRRLRRRVQEAIDAGIFPVTPNIQHKPEMYEVCARAAGSAMDWHTFMPICATDLGKSQHIQDDSKYKPNAPNPSVRERFRERLGRRSAPTPSNNDDDVKYDAQPSTLQVAVLIAMPSEHSSIPSLDSAPLCFGSPEGEPRNLPINVTDDTIPDVLFGVSNFTVISDETDP